MDAWSNKVELQASSKHFKLLGRARAVLIGCGAGLSTIRPSWFYGVVAVVRGRREDLGLKWY